MTSIDRDDSWGVYRPGIESHLAACADYLGRLERSVAGEIAPDRRYYHDKAHELHEAVRVLVRRGQDIERWMRACDATVESEEDGHTVVGTCERPSGHAGPHDDDPPRESVEQLCQRARSLADLTEQVSHRLGAVAPGVDHRLALGHSVAQEDLDMLRGAASALDNAGRGVRELAERVRDVATGNEVSMRNSSVVRRLDLSSHGPGVGL